MDSVGLMDTASTNDGREAYIAEMIQYIQSNNLKVCRVFFTVPLGGRQMTEMTDWIAVLLEALGGHKEVGCVAYWVITKWNLDSKRNRSLCEKDKANDNGTFETLSKLPQLNFDVLTHGEDNQDQLFATVVDTGSTTEGLSKAAMNINAEHHENIVKNVDRLETGVRSLNDSIALIGTNEDFQKQEAQLRHTLHQAAVDLADCGKSKDKKRQYEEMIHQAIQELAKCSDLWRDAKASKEEKLEQLKVLNASYRKQLDELKAREDLMENLGTLVGVGLSTVVSKQVSKQVLKLRA